MRVRVEREIEELTAEVGRLKSELREAREIVGEMARNGTATVAAITIAAGGTVRVPRITWADAPRYELTRWDDEMTDDVVFTAKPRERSETGL